MKGKISMKDGGERKTMKNEKNEEKMNTKNEGVRRRDERNQRTKLKRKKNE